MFLCISSTITMPSRWSPKIHAVLRRYKSKRPGGPKGAHPICVNWEDAEKLSDGIRRAIVAHGAIDLAVSWIHSTVPEAPFVIVDAIQSLPRSVPLRYFQIYGTGTNSNQQIKENWHTRLAALHGVQYFRIQLGQRRSEGRMRWLTDDEISAGVIDAIEVDRPDTWVGDA